MAKGAVGSARGGLHVPDDQLEQRRQIDAFLGEIGDRPAGAARGVERREIELLVGGVERGEEIEDLVMHLVGARIASGRSC